MHNNTMKSLEWFNKKLYFLNIVEIKFERNFIIN
ncbi:hypothetical protein GGR31_001117 [Mesonia maritima]|uniref:Uncharacterized protein n=1 Tax=Mesonia maritima TaxID=1793873 RepID=A0ABU1K5B4_9FLAO|nr:hypothetical protein [Mesonia maritima]